MSSLQRQPNEFQQRATVDLDESESVQEPVVQKRKPGRPKNIVTEQVVEKEMPATKRLRRK